MKKEKEEDLHKAFQERSPHIIGEMRWRVHSVLLPFVWERGEVHILFQRRAKSLRQQPEEVSFPGGRVEPGETSQQAARRECQEELLLPEEDISIYGPGEILATPSGRRIDSFIGALPHYQGTFSRAEVDSVFTVPLAFFRQTVPTTYVNHLRLDMAEDFPYGKIPGGRNYRWELGDYPMVFYQYRGDIIWGLTARLMQANMKLIDQYDLEGWFRRTGDFRDR